MEIMRNLVRIIDDNGIRYIAFDDEDYNSLPAELFEKDKVLDAPPLSLLGEVCIELTKEDFLIDDEAVNEIADRCTDDGWKNNSLEGIIRQILRYYQEAIFRS